MLLLFNARGFFSCFVNFFDVSFGGRNFVKYSRQLLPTFHRRLRPCVP